MDQHDANIDRYVLDWHACTDQAELNRFWDRIPQGLEDAVIDRLNELFPADPNECTSDPYTLRTKALGRGLEEFMALLMARTNAEACTQREGRTVRCERCEQFLIDFPRREP